MKAVYKKDLKSAFTGMIGWVLCAFVVVVVEMCIRDREWPGRSGKGKGVMKNMKKMLSAALALAVALGLSLIHIFFILERGCPFGELIQIHIEEVHGELPVELPQLVLPVF